MNDYAGPRWLPGGHLQTIWPALLGRPLPPGWALPAYRRERWTTPDDDFIDVDGLEAPTAEAPLLVLFHGLEGNSGSPYARAFAGRAQQRGLHYAVPHFRGCSGELNRAPRAYHSGDHEEIGWILQRLRDRHAGPLVAVGISLGGNALLRWAQEAGHTARSTVAALAAICSPLDLAASGRAIGQGLSRQIYTRMFLRSMKPKALAKWAQFPGLFDRDRLQAARDLWDFDNVFTGPLHGFAGTDDYWQRASARPHLQRLRVPSLVLNALNDPFVPAGSLPQAHEVSDWVQRWQPRHGGHVGFPTGGFPSACWAMPDAVTRWLLEAASLTEWSHG